MKTGKLIQQKDLAAMLQVSTMTISKALRDHPDISLEMRKRVKELAKEMGYRPHFVARNLSSKKTFTIGVVMPKIAHSFYACILDGIDTAAKKKGYEIVLKVSRESAQIEGKNIQTLLAMRVDGLLVSVSQETKDYEIFRTVKDIGVPLVFFDRAIDELDISSVTVDDRIGAARAVEHAIKLGYRKIAHFAGYPNVDISRKRRDGYLDALKQHGIPIDENLILEVGFGDQAGYEGFMQFYESQNLPEVIFAVSDSVAFGVYRAARDTGVEISRDIGLIGFTDVQVTDILSPPLTTVHEPAELIGIKAVNMLVREIESTEPTKPQQILLKAELKIRESCGEKYRMLNNLKV